MGFLGFCGLGFFQESVNISISQFQLGQVDRGQEITG
jgi:hypothetical protein